MKIYRVMVEVPVYVVAEDETEANLVGMDNAGEEIMNGNADMFAEEIISPLQLKPSVLDSLPWGGEDDRTIRDILGHEKS